MKAHDISIIYLGEQVLDLFVENNLTNIEMLGLLEAIKFSVSTAITSKVNEV